MPLHQSSRPHLTHLLEDRLRRRHGRQSTSASSTATVLTAPTSWQSPCRSATERKARMRTCHRPGMRSRQVQTTNAMRLQRLVQPDLAFDLHCPWHFFVQPPAAPSCPTLWKRTSPILSPTDFSRDRYPDATTFQSPRASEIPQPIRWSETPLKVSVSKRMQEFKKDPLDHRLLTKSRINLATSERIETWHSHESCGQSPRYAIE